VVEDFLRAAPRTRDEVWQFAAQQGFAERTLFRVKADLQIEARRRQACLLLAIAKPGAAGGGATGILARGDAGVPSADSGDGEGALKG
jgi:hypothetical protein